MKIKTRDNLFGYGDSFIALFAVVLIACAVILSTLLKDDSADHAYMKAAVVSTDCGEVSGKIDTAVGGTNISTYRNIPYAVPPLKELRWKASTLLSEGDDMCWSEEYNGALDNIIKCVPTLV